MTTYLAVLLIVALESMGLPVPGETALITASIYAGTTHHLDITGVIIAAILGAVLGDNLGFLIGRKFGIPLLNKYGKYIRLNKKRLILGQYLFDRYGSRVVFWGRFVAILRIFAAFLAGVNRMGWKKFLVFNLAGGVVWATFYGLLGFTLGSELHKIESPLKITMLLLGILISLGIFVYLKYNEKRLETQALKKFTNQNS